MAWLAATPAAAEEGTRMEHAMRIRQLLPILGLWMAMPGALGAPNTTGGAAPAEYRLAPGDVIEVTVTPQHSFDRTVTIQPDGMISFPIVGQLQAAGLPVRQLGTALRTALNRELVDPQVTISLRETSKRELGRASLLGAVRTQGEFEVRQGTTLVDALAAAGGANPAADLHRITITRTDGTVKTVDLSQTDHTGRLEQNLRLEPGDIIVVPEGAPLTVLVLGDVTKPGSYEIHRDSRLLDVLSLAGGATEKADLRRVTLARQGVPGSRSLDLQPLLAKGDTTNPEINLLLQPGDTLFVPATEQQSYVLVNVGKPGLYPIRPNDRVLDVLVTAGGAGTEISKAVLVRRAANGQPAPRELDLKKIMAKGDQTENALLQPGDVLYVPDKKTHRSVSEAASLIWPLSSLFTLLR
jgi:polysaccharide biosynthesis/export protein